MQLTIKELAAYLPYKLKIQNDNGDEKYICELGGIQNNKIYDITGAELEYAKPLLRPLSSLTKQITHNGETFVPINRFNRELHNSLKKEIELTNGNPIIDFLQYGVVEKLLSWHFDLYNLIPQNLAINHETLK